MKTLLRNVKQNMISVFFDSFEWIVRFLVKGNFDFQNYSNRLS